MVPETALAYCGARHPDGWYCVLRNGHDPKEPHLSLDNRDLWKGSPGRPVRWAEEGHPVAKTPPSPPRALPGFTGEPCDRCHSPNTVRTGKCLTCQDCFHSGTCG